MDAMKLPGFTAEASLAKTGGHYRTGDGAIPLRAHERGALHLSATDVPGEVIEIEDDAPWTPPSWGGHAGPGTSGPPSEGVGGGGGGGSGETAEPSDKPPNLDKPILHGCSSNQIGSKKARPCVKQAEHDLMHNVSPPHVLKCTGIRHGKVIHPKMQCCRGTVCKAL
jgi:hypothetical protein